MANLDALSDAVDRLAIAEIPKDIAPDVTMLLSYVRKRLAVIKAMRDVSDEMSDVSDEMSDVSDEIKALTSVRTQGNLRQIHITTLEELCEMTIEELSAAFERAGVKNMRTAIRLIRRELNRHGITHKLGAE